MENLSHTHFMVDDWQVSPTEGLLTRVNETVHLEPKVMEVLVYFASRSGEVITREQLERDVWRGAVVGYDAVTASVIKLRKALQDNARQPRIILTIPKKGYKLIAQITFPEQNEKSVPVSSNEGNTQKIMAEKYPRSLFKIGIASAILVTVIVLTWLGLSQKPDIHSDTVPSIVVLPIENLGASEEHDVFVDGITEDIITDLSRLSNLMVFASNTTFKYKGRQVSPQALRDELNVDFVFKGNARRYGDQIRINVQLVNSETGFNVWAQRYDRKVSEIFAIQDEIAVSLIDALTIRLSSNEKQRLAQRATNNLQAYDHFLEGQRLSRRLTPEAMKQALDEYRKAIIIDPTYGRAYGAMAYNLAHLYRLGLTDSPVETINRALALAEQAVELDSSIPQTHWSLGYVYLMNKQHDRAEKAVTEAIRVAPNYADGYGLLALINNNLGNADKALKYATRGMQLNPYYTWDYLYNLGRAHYTLGNYDQAIGALEKAQQRNENAIPVKLILAASYVQAGRIDDAEWLTEDIQVLNPATTLTHTANAIPLADPKLKKKLLEDLRKAGLPE